MREAWQANIPLMWKERKIEIPEGMKPEELIKVPENAQYFAALGAVEFGKDEEPAVGRYLGIEKLLYYIDYGRAEEKAVSGGKGLVAEDAELVQFKEEYRKKKFVPAEFLPGQTVSGFIGIDGGSTSTKAVLLGNGEKSFARLTSFPTAIPSRMGSRCLRSCVSKSKPKAPRWRFWG
jgi:activator of 2-hydroxyglutaryl-CoA dehydratase